jgi:hypothetical protein
MEHAVITPFLRDQAFDPETLKTMSDVFAQTREMLGLKDRDDPLTKLVARRIIDLAQRGVRTRTGLYLMTMQEFMPTRQ